MSGGLGSRLWRWLLVPAAAVAVAGTFISVPAEAAAPGAAPSGGGGIAGRPAPMAAAKGWLASYGAGIKSPAYVDKNAKYWYQCVSDQTKFKITRASIVMWSNGVDRIKGFHFKYRLVARGTDGQPQWWSNWSKNVTASFKTNKKISRWMNASKLGQSFSSTAAWDMEIKVKYPRSLRTAFRQKYRVPIVTPQCGVLEE